MLFIDLVVIGITVTCNNNDFGSWSWVPLSLLTELQVLLLHLDFVHSDLRLALLYFAAMPSIRIRGSAYSSLRDGPASANATPQPRPKIPVFLVNADPDTPTPPPGPPIPPRMQRSMPTLRDQALSSSESPQQSQVPPRRPRSGTTTSRIHTYVLHSARRYPRAGASDTESRISTERTVSPLLAVPQDGMVTMEGPQADVIVRSSGQPSRIGSALSLPDGNHENFFDMDDRTQGEVHHDDVVEHLDVIGESRLTFNIRNLPQLTSSQTPRLRQCRI